LAPGEGSSAPEESEVSDNENAPAGQSETDLPNAIRLLRGPGN
jgi:hypothetical protein